MQDAVGFLISFNCKSTNESSSEFFFQIGLDLTELWP